MLWTSRFLQQSSATEKNQFYCVPLLVPQSVTLMPTQFQPKVHRNGLGCVGEGLYEFKTLASKSGLFS